jgi:hypothetical protein
MLRTKRNSSLKTITRVILLKRKNTEAKGSPCLICQEQKGTVL